MKGDWCPYSNIILFCQEESDCPDCNVYYQTMPVPYDGRTVGEIEKAGNRLFNTESLTKVVGGCKVV